MPFSKNKVITAWAEKGMIHLKFDYNPDFSNAFKAELPRGSWRWNPKVDKKTGLPNPDGDNTWLIDPGVLDDLNRVAEKFGLEIQVAASQTAAPVQVVLPIDAYEQMFGVLSNDMMKSIYRQVSLKLHPDAGGDPDKYALFNSAWDEVKRKRGM